MNETELEPILITGANGHLGRRLIAALLPVRPIVAVVRSRRAADFLRKRFERHPRLLIHALDPCDTQALSAAGRGCRQAVHLIGKIKIGKTEALADSHERPAAALAGCGFAHIVYVSILGAAPSSTSACLRARHAVETIFGNAGSHASIVRVPMVLGEQDRASFALAKRARSKRVVLFRGASLEQPIYAGDVIAAIETLLYSTPLGIRLFELAGPQSLTRIELVRRAAGLCGTNPRIVSVPLALGLTFAAIAESFLANPPVTTDMLRILDHDDAIDPGPAAEALGLRLTSLEHMLERCVVKRL